jgi:hypothetical protein
MSRAIHFHDGRLVAHNLGADGSLHLQIRLDPVWNGGSDRVVDIRLLGIANVSEVREYFAEIERAERQFERVDQGTASWDSSAPFERLPTVMGLEFLGEGGDFLVSVDLLFLGSLDVLCQRIECNERSSLQFVYED